MDKYSDRMKRNKHKYLHETTTKTITRELYSDTVHKTLT